MVLARCRVALAALLSCLSLLFMTAASAQSLTGTHQERVDAVNRNTVGLVSGGVGGTYIKIAADLQAVLDTTSNLRVLPIVGKGSVQNITDLLYMRGIDIAIVQSDVLAYLKGDGNYPNLDSRIAYIAKLYNEEFHLVARRDVTDIRQLEGKTVNFGPEGSGTAMTAQVVFNSLGINVNATTENYQDALQKVKDGQIDAMVYVAGKPASIFTAVAPGDGLHVVPVAYDAKLQESYLPASISAQDYPGLVGAGGTVDTVAVGAVMAVFNWKQRTGRYYTTKVFVEAFMDNFPEFLKEPRHPKWAEVNLAAELPGWQRYSVAQEWLASNANRAALAQGQQDQRMEELVVAFEKFLKDQPQTGLMSPAEREALFRQFLKWSKLEGASASN
jgi:TRAP transporter TAXI family solute receptor